MYTYIYVCVCVKVRKSLGDRLLIDEANDRVQARLKIKYNTFGNTVHLSSFDNHIHSFIQIKFNLLDR